MNMRKVSLCLVCLLLACCKREEPSVGAAYLSEMGPELAQTFTDGSWGFGGHGRLGNAEFTRITVGGEAYIHGIGAQPPSKGGSHVHYDLGRKYKTLEGKVAINDTSTEVPAPLTFRIKSDGRELWRSGPVEAKKPPLAFKLDVTDVAHVELIVDCPGSNTGAHAVWLDPILEP